MLFQSPVELTTIGKHLPSTMKDSHRHKNQMPNGPSKGTALHNNQKTHTVHSRRRLVRHPFQH